MTDTITQSDIEQAGDYVICNLEAGDNGVAMQGRLKRIEDGEEIDISIYLQIKDGEEIDNEDIYTIDRLIYACRN